METEVFCALYHLWIVQAAPHPIRHFAKPPGVMCDYPFVRREAIDKTRKFGTILLTKPVGDIEQ